MSAKRSYCLADKPFPVSAKALNTLKMVAYYASLPKHYAPAQIERLRRSGYVTPVPGGCDLYGITDAGRALLARGRGR